MGSAMSSFSYYTPLTKKLRHDISVCSESSHHHQGQEQGANLDSTVFSVNESALLMMMPDGSYEDYHGHQGVVNNNVDVLCGNCDDASPAIALCNTCPETPSLCKLCLDAHQRVKLTKDHDITITDEEMIEESMLTHENVVKCAIELVEINGRMECVDVDHALQETLTQLKNLSKKDPDFKLTEATKIRMLNLFNQKRRRMALEIVQTVVDIGPRDIVVMFANIEWCLPILGDSNDSDNREKLLALDIILRVLQTDKKSLIIKFVRDIKHKLPIKQFKQDIYPTSIMFKAGKLSREVEKIMSK